MSGGRGAVRGARLLLTPRGHAGKHNDAWRLDRARWLHQYGDKAIAAAELADINALRDLYRFNGKDGNDEIPASALEEPVGSEIPTTAQGEGSSLGTPGGNPDKERGSSPSG